MTRHGDKIAEKLAKCFRVKQFSNFTPVFATSHYKREWKAHATRDARNFIFTELILGAGTSLRNLKRVCFILLHGTVSEPLEMLALRPSWSPQQLVWSKPVESKDSDWSWSWSMTLRRTVLDQSGSVRGKYAHVPLITIVFDYKMKPTCGIFRLSVPNHLKYLLRCKDASLSFARSPV